LIGRPSAKYFIPKNLCNKFVDFQKQTKYATQRGQISTIRESETQKIHKPPQIDPRPLGRQKLQDHEVKPLTLNQNFRLMIPKSYKISSLVYFLRKNGVCDKDKAIYFYRDNQTLIKSGNLFPFCRFPNHE
jgi:hypothetical protein